MHILYLASFIGGLLLAVRIMIAGVERSREESPSGERTFRISLPVFAAFAVVFGIVGYILFRRQVGSILGQVGWAVLAGMIAAAVTARLVRQWWAVTPEHDVEDERYILQGHLAQVTKSIASDADGEVAFEVDNERKVLTARGIDASVIAAGSDVVIERIEDDVAYVESWAEVEKRL
jgi:hypothetical protein